MDRKQVAGLLLGIAVGLSFAPGSALAQEASEVAKATLTVTGEGIVKVAPDMATLDLGAVAQDSEAAVAMRDVSARIAEVMTQLEQAGIAPEDIQTSSLSVHPQYIPRPDPEETTPRVERFEASSELTVRVRDLDQLGTLLDAVVQNGANLMRGLSFGLQDAEKSQDAARTRAVEDAMRKAALYADAAGVTLGTVLSLQEHGAMATPKVFRAEAAPFAAESMPVAKGEISVSAGVTMTFSMSPAE